MSDPKNIFSGIAAFQHPILRRSLGQLLAHPPTAQKGLKELVVA